jgi:hypothetical protein
VTDEERDRKISEINVGVWIIVFMVAAILAKVFGDG